MITVETLGSSSLGNAYRLVSGDRSLLLECGIPWNKIKKKLNYQTSNLDGCLLSHAHGDHCRAIKSVMDAGIDVIATVETFAQALSVPHHRAVEVKAGDWFEVGGFWHVRAFETVHDTPGSLGFLIWDDTNDHLLFITDTAYVRYLFSPVEIIMIEANFSETILQEQVANGLIDPGRARRVRENHMAVERVMDFLQSQDLSRCREIRLLHLSAGNSDEVEFKRMVQETTGIVTIVECE